MHWEVLVSSAEYLSEDLAYLATVKESILLGKQVLRGVNHELPIPGGDQIASVPHEDECLCPGLLSLRLVQIHRVPIKVSIVRSADTLIESEGSAL